MKTRLDRHYLDAQRILMEALDLRHEQQEAVLRLKYRGVEYAVVVELDGVWIRPVLAEEDL